MKRGCWVMVALAGCVVLLGCEAECEAGTVRVGDSCVSPDAGSAPEDGGMCPVCPSPGDGGACPVCADGGSCPVCEPTQCGPSLCEPDDPADRAAVQTYFQTVLVRPTAPDPERVIWRLPLADQTTYQIEVDTLMGQNQSGLRYASRRQLVVVGIRGENSILNVEDLHESKNDVDSWGTAADVEYSVTAEGGTGELILEVPSTPPTGGESWWTVRARVLRVYVGA